MKTRSWRKACFFRLNEVAISNAHVMFQETHPDFPWCDARKELAKQLLEVVTALQAAQSWPRRLHRPSIKADRLNRSCGHWPEKVPGRRGQCAVHKATRKRSTVFCSHCKVYLCVVPCFKVYHTEVKLPNW